MKLIVGLGNPGKEYENTRHNAGFMVLDLIAKKNDSAWKKELARKSVAAKIDVDEEKVILAKPQTFMNLSGQAVSALLSYYKIQPEDLLVVQDDVDLPAGTFAFNYGSGSAGHHGIESIQAHLGKVKISRLRVGVGGTKGKAKDLVLEKPSKEEWSAISKAISDAAEASLDWASGGMQDAMNKWNHRKKPEVRR